MNAAISILVLWMSIFCTEAEWVLSHSSLPPYSTKHPEKFVLHLGWFNTEQGETTNLTINVKKSEAVGKSIPLYISGEGGRPELTSLINMQHSTFYHDLDTHASFSLTSFDGEPFTMKGSFLLDKEIYDVEPYHVKVHKRSLRADTGNYIIKRRSADSSSAIAKMESEANKKLVEALKNLEQMEKDFSQRKQTSEESSDFIYPPGEYNFGSSSQMNEDTGSKRRKRQTLPSTTYIVELYIIVDYYLYVNLTQSANRIEWTAGTDDYIAFYIGHQANEIDVRYRNIDSSISPVYGTWTIGTKFSNLLVAKVEDNSVWTYPRFTIGLALDAYHGYAKLNSWIAENEKVLPSSSDHILLITSLDLHRHGHLTAAGVSRLRGVCGQNRSSLNQMGSSAVYAHELGHNLGALHDGSDNDCNEEDQLIMSAIRRTATNRTAGNSWRFSSCSVKYFDDFLRTLNRNNKNCLRNPGRYVDSWADDYSQYIGQKITLDEQCKLARGPNYRYLRSHFSKVCTELACVSNTGRSLIGSDKVTSPYTSCGNKKWCVESKCVYDTNAPEVDEECPVPDGKDKVFSNSEVLCHQLTGFHCANHVWARSYCCRKCRELFTPWLGPNCTHGDQYNYCKRISSLDCRYQSRYCCQKCCHVTKPAGAETCSRPPSTTSEPTTKKPPPISQQISLFKLALHILPFKPRN